MSLIDKVLTRKEFEDKPPVLLDIGASGTIHKKWKRIAKYSICIAFDADTRDFNPEPEIAKKYRKQHLGTELLNKMIEHLKNEYNEIVETITLEVRTHNQAAIAFYEKHGFEGVLIKPAYYSNGEDALYMVRRLI